MGFQIEFRKSGKVFEWEENFPNLLDFAESKGIQIDNNCRIGVCGTCKVKLLSGKVFMETEDGLSEEEKKGGMILPCVAAPSSDLVIEA